MSSICFEGVALDHDQIRLLAGNDGADTVELSQKLGAVCSRNVNGVQGCESGFNQQLNFTLIAEAAKIILSFVPKEGIRSVGMGYSRELLLTQIACRGGKYVAGLPPIKRMAPMTTTRITANITAYSAMSWPSSCNQNVEKMSHVHTPDEGLHCISPNCLVDGHFDLIRRPEVGIPERHC